MNGTSDEFKNDHDALNTLITEFRLFREDIKEDIKDLKNNLAIRVDTVELEISKVVDRIQVIEKKQSNLKTLVGVYLSVGVFVIGLIIYHIVEQ